MTVKNIKGDVWAIAAIACLLTGAMGVSSINRVRAMDTTSTHTIADAGHSGHSAPSSHSDHGAQTDAGHGNAPHGNGSHHHGAIAVTDADRVPQVMLVVQPDARRGWNVQVQTENFIFAPERVNQENRPNEGHAHLYVDGQKVARLYGNWYHLGNLEPGIREIRVSLHANGHEAWSYEGEAIAHSVTVNVPAHSTPDMPSMGE
ncbi:MAG: hypothetical protein AB4042_20030 [Leptolyngbyaceae cyanobacterium]